MHVVTLNVFILMKKCQRLSNYALFHDNITLIDEFAHVLVVDNYVSVHLDNFEFKK
jgi:hypothetical protein